jgi:hypothetical protein
MFGPIASRAVERALHDRGSRCHRTRTAESLERRQLRLDLQGSVLVRRRWAAPRLVPRVPAGVPDRPAAASCRSTTPGASEGSSTCSQPAT